MSVQLKSYLGNFKLANKSNKNSSYNQNQLRIIRQKLPHQPTPDLSSEKLHSQTHLSHHPRSPTQKKSLRERGWKEV